MKKSIWVFAVIAGSVLSGCSSNTISDKDIVCPKDYTMNECEEFKYWKKYYSENPERIKEDMKKFEEDLENELE
jgi:ABC-type phosphate/phosphonate transport system substrate-binding protein